MSAAPVKNSNVQDINAQLLPKTQAKVLGSDIKSLKEIPEYPQAFLEQNINYYREPIKIEYYMTKESRFAAETKYLFLELIDPVAKNKNQKRIFSYFKNKNEPIDIIKAMDVFPVFMKTTLLHYLERMPMLESLSMMYRAGLQGSPLEIRKSLYMNETLRKKEPSVPGIEIFGDFTLYNINWAVRFLNQKNIEHSLEDATIAHLIMLNKNKMLENKTIDNRFLILSDIFLQQAFPFSSEEDKEILSMTYSKKHHFI